MQAAVCVCASIGLCACQPSATTVALPSPQILHMQITPALDRLRPALHACAAEEALGLVVDSLPATALDPSQTDLALRWSAPAETSDFAAVLAEEALVVIVHPTQERAAVTRGELRALYSAGQQAGGLNPWAYPPGDDVQQAFETLVLQGPPEQPLPVFLAPDPPAMLEAVAEDPNAIGFVPAGWVTGQVRVLPVSDLDTEESLQPILAISTAEPQGAARAMLLCLQTQIR